MNPDALLASLTLEQKVAQLSCVFLRGLTEFSQFSEVKARAQLANGIGWIICLQDDGETSTQDAVENLREAQAFLRQHAPGETRTVLVEIPAELLAFHGIDQTLNVESGPYEVMLGSSAADIHAKQFFTVTAARPIARRTVFGAKAS